MLLAHAHALALLICFFPGSVVRSQYVAADFRFGLLINEFPLTKVGSVDASSSPLLSQLIATCNPHNPAWNRALDTWSTWYQHSNPEATPVPIQVLPRMRATSFDFHVCLIYPGHVNWNGRAGIPSDEQRAQTALELQLRQACLELGDDTHLLPPLEPVGPLTRACATQYPAKEIEVALGRAIQHLYGWRVNLHKPRLQVGDTKG